MSILRHDAEIKRLQQDVIALQKRLDALEAKKPGPKPKEKAE